ncbi:ImmA/IrrE family metallo-endopeptidase [Fictibacillus sp. JL2B1089]|uniref:ImmA/IrrE family metallo-endopeptidase n=1 Tax=Fictibacillus sp. JL2B1089 TaxID=3399565 RepID=UPI003A85700A
MDLITSKVSKLIKKHQTNCPFKIAKNLGIVVLHEELGNFLGYYNKTFRIPFIHINEKADDKLQSFICAHELGHALLHPDANTPFLTKHTFFSTESYEKEANLFAVKLLFSEDYLLDTILISEAIQEFGVPRNVIMSFIKL